MPDYPIYRRESSTVASFERHDLDWSLVGTVVAPGGSMLFVGQRSGVLRLLVPSPIELGGPCYLYAGDAMASAKLGEHGLSWEPAVAPVEFPDEEPATAVAAPP